MNGLNVATIVNTWVEQSGLLPFMIYNDLIPYANKDGAALRHDPAPAAERRFADGTRLVKWNLTYYIRCKHSEDARGYAYAITTALDGLTITDRAGFEIDTEALTLPQFIGKDDNDFTTYSAAITGAYLEEK